LNCLWYTKRGGKLRPRPENGGWYMGPGHKEKEGRKGKRGFYGKGKGQKKP